MESLHEKEKKRLKQTFEIYTNGVKAELDHYQLIKQEEKKHHLMSLTKQKQKKKGAVKQQQQALKQATDEQKEAQPPIQPKIQKVNRITSAFANLTIHK